MAAAGAAVVISEAASASQGRDGVGRFQITGLKPAQYPRRPDGRRSGGTTLAITKIRRNRRPPSEDGEAD
jgi:hypothetical protein